jgi:rubredoxin
VALAVSQQVMIRDLESFISGFDDRMNRIFDERSVNGGVSLATLRQMNAELHERFRADIRAEIQRYSLGGPTRTTNTTGGGTAETRGDPAVGFQPHHYGGKFHKVPENWRFPKCNAKLLWVQWNVGDTVNNVPPLRTLIVNDFKHLDELRKNVPRGQKKPREVRKTWNEISTLCNYIEKIATEKGAYRMGATRDVYGSMYDSIATEENGLKVIHARETTLSWYKTFHAVEAILKAERDAARAAAAAAALSDMSGTNRGVPV